MINFDRIANLIDPCLETYREDDFVYLLHPNTALNSNILLQEMPSALVIWSNEYSAKSIIEVFTVILNNTSCDLIFPYIETEEEYRAVISLGAEPIEFKVEDDEDLSKEYGSYIIRK